MKKRDFLKAGAAAGLVLPAAAIAQQSGPTYNWKMATGWASGPLMDIGAKAFAERMDQLSGGRFKIQAFPGRRARQRAQGAGDREERRGRMWPHLDGLRLGQGSDHRAVRRLRRLVRHRADAALDLRGGGDEMQRKYRDENEGIVSIPLFIRTAEVFLHSRKPVKTLADLKGPEAPHRGRVARDGEGPRRGAGDHRRRRRLSDARARRDRRDRVGHAVGEHHARASTRWPST